MSTAIRIPTLTRTTEQRRPSRLKGLNWIALVVAALVGSGCSVNLATEPCNALAVPRCAMADLQGLTVAPENRCSAYDRDDYQYSQNVEDLIIANLGGVYSPYTGEWFDSKYDTDIEHMVAVSEAHDSGLCAAELTTRSTFAEDLLNLTLASPQVNRHEKKHYDAAEWQPEKNACWFAGRVIAVRKKYNLTIDRAERQALEHLLKQCDSLPLEKADA